MSINIKYKGKYEKYKIKYINLKNKIQQGSNRFDDDSPEEDDFDDQKTPSLPKNNDFDEEEDFGEEDFGEEEVKPKISQLPLPKKKSESIIWDLVLDDYGLPEYFKSNKNEKRLIDDMPEDFYYGRTLISKESFIKRLALPDISFNTSKVSVTTEIKNKIKTYKIKKIELEPNYYNRNEFTLEKSDLIKGEICIGDLKYKYDDDTLNKWLNMICKYNLFKQYYETKEIIFYRFYNGFDILNFLLNNSDKLTELKSLIFMDGKDLYNNFNQPLGNSLDKFVNLKSLTFGASFDKPLENSLDKLTNLTSLTFGRLFDQILENSLDKLINLTSLTFGDFFMRPLENSLDKLTNLTSLTFGHSFDQPLERSLNNLTNLKFLKFGDSFNQLLENSLDKLTNLRCLIFGNEFNQSLTNKKWYGNTSYHLHNFKNLQTLKFGSQFDKFESLIASLNDLKNQKALNKFKYLYLYYITSFNNVQYINQIKTVNNAINILNSRENKNLKCEDIS